MQTFRSAIESFHDCPRLRYNQYHYNGTGLSRVSKAVPLVTGVNVHKGVEVIATAIMKGESINLDDACATAVESYIKDCETQGFSGRRMAEDRQQAFTFAEQKALTEALIRAWALVELPNIMNRYKILAVEREIQPLEITSGVELLARVDMELQENGSGDYYNYSLKTQRGWTDRDDNSYRNDLQSLTEMWAVEQDSLRTYSMVSDIIRNIQILNQVYCFSPKNLLAIHQYLTKYNTYPKKVMGTRFCFLIKGSFRKPDYGPDSLYTTYNAMIRGYKYVSPTGIQYSHSWLFDTPNNKSGKSKLGAGWVPFNVWESDISIADWIHNLNSGNIQPEAGNPVRQSVITPAEYFRDEGELVEAMMEIKNQEIMVAQGIRELERSNNDRNVMSIYFPHRRKKCQWVFGDICPYYELCWKPEIAADPLGGDEPLYQIRVPHHDTENK